MEEYVIPLGKAAIKKEGKDLTLVATSYMVSKAIEVSEQFERDEGFTIEIIDPRTLTPLDLEVIIESVKKTGKLVILHEACRKCGIGAEISSQITEKAFDFLDAPIRIIASLDCPIPYSEVLEKAVIPDEYRITKVIKEVLKY